MRRALTILALAVLGTLTWQSTAHAANYVIYAQGRSWGSWESTTAGTSWADKTLVYNGNAKLDGIETNGKTDPTKQVRAAVKLYCSGANSCIIHCYSAGCLRVEKAVADLRADTSADGSTLPGLMWIEASASAAGGTELAAIATGGFTGFIAKLLGQQEAIDRDLTPSKARSAGGGGWGYVQDKLGANMWHIAGRQDICKTIIFFKICGNSHLLGYGDGVVPWHSSAGYNTASAKTSMCNYSVADEKDTTKGVGNKYTWHRTDTFYLACNGTNSQTGAGYDHFGIPPFATAIVKLDIAGGSTTWELRGWSDTTLCSGSTCAECSLSGTQCDNAFSSTAQNFSMRTDLTTVASSVGSGSSNTTVATTAANSCVGHCGGAPASGTCSCAGVSTNKCTDYATAHCDIVNQ